MARKYVKKEGGGMNGKRSLSLSVVLCLPTGPNSRAQRPEPPSWLLTVLGTFQNVICSTYVMYIM